MCRARKLVGESESHPAICPEKDRSKANRATPVSTHKNNTSNSYCWAHPI